jgi:hypothetical protein
MPPHRQQGTQPPFGAAPSEYNWFVRGGVCLFDQSAHLRGNRRMGLRCKVVMDHRGLSSSTPSVSERSALVWAVIDDSGTGRRKALLIGINYTGSSSALRGCINDAHNVQKFLIGQSTSNIARHATLIIQNDTDTNQRISSCLPTKLGTQDRSRPRPT